MQTQSKKRLRSESKKPWDRHSIARLTDETPEGPLFLAPTSGQASMNISGGLEVTVAPIANVAPVAPIATEWTSIWESSHRGRLSDQQPPAGESQRETADHTGGMFSFQNGKGRVPYPIAMSAAEKRSEARLAVRRRKRHDEALSGRDGRTDRLFPDPIPDDDWRDIDHPVSTKTAKPYKKFVAPTGQLTRDMLKEIVTRMGLPLKREMALMVDLFYRHYHVSASAAAPKIPMESSIYAILAVHKHVEKPTKALVEGAYLTFRTLMNDAGTYDNPQIAARNRVQAPEGSVIDEFLPIPKTKKHGTLDKRFTAGAFHSARDMRPAEIHVYCRWRKRTIHGRFIGHGPARQAV